MQVGQAASDFTIQAYVVKYLIRVGRSKIPKEHLLSYVNAPLANVFLESHLN